MADTERPSTPPQSAKSHSATTELTPEQVRRIEENRLKAKAIRTQREAEESRQQATSTSSGPPALRTPSGYIVGQKRPHSAVEPSQRDGRQPNDNSASAANGASGTATSYNDIQAARKFMQYVDYDFSKMTDTKGGFLTVEDDPHNRALHTPGDQEEQRPAHMTVKEWERHRLLRKLRDARAGPFEPGLGGKTAGTDEGCRECGVLEIDWKWMEVFGLRVCNSCKEANPEKYSLLTKTEAREDYLLTDPELRDPELLPRLERPNPHKATWNNMQLYLRCQVEEYAFSERKWGSAEKLDAEFEKRQADKKKRKEDKFKSKLDELKKRTRVEAWRRARASGGKAGGRGDSASAAQFGDKITNRGDKHEHEWGRTVTDAEGVGRKTCIDCGLEVEEIEF